MTDQLERDLRALFAEDAERAPAAGALADDARRRARRHRRSRMAWGAGALVAASVTAVAVLGGTALRDAPTVEQAATSSPTSRPSGALPMGPLGEVVSCAFGYSPREVGRSAFAFDGTVVAFGPAHSDRPRGVLHHVGVTFTVSEWFAGGSGPTVTVDMPQPGGWSEDGLVTYGLGSRLLVSGDHRWGGTTMADAIAGYCGFTRYYDEATADSWRAATR
ncbi:hypothetical protein GCM10020358_70260 [Amorphoplanes nipponensis]|uniref:Uncharacterized protein n=1 Tax=Actinoplanes nipponensis TaxID=135950 RepID=A0A919JL48_9ACTN|nr:hypothetical protein [Actinoplanes nipponensis]GIE51151.1 hypothetical protein Ani05nite_46850 [Actinoplanes nipponensis]